MPRHDGYFFIKSQLNGYVLDVEGGDPSPGTQVVMWPQKDEDFSNQLWYRHRRTRTIRSKINDLCLSMSGGDLCVKEYDDDDGKQQWKMTAKGTIRNREDRSKVMDIKGVNKDKGAEVGTWEYNGGENQFWDFVQVDDPLEYGNSGSSSDDDGDFW